MVGEGQEARPGRAPGWACVRAGTWQFREINATRRTCFPTGEMQPGRTTHAQVCNHHRHAQISTSAIAKPSKPPALQRPSKHAPNNTATLEPTLRLPLHPAPPTPLHPTHPAPTSALSTSHLLHPSQTSSNPPTTSPQTPAHSLLASLSSHPPLSIHRTPSSLLSPSLLHSAITSLTPLSRRSAITLVWRAICSVSARYESVETSSRVELARPCSAYRGVEEGRGSAVKALVIKGRSGSIVSGGGGWESGDRRVEVVEARARVWCARCEVRAVWEVVSLVNG